MKNVLEKTRINAGVIFLVSLMTLISYDFCGATGVGALTGQSTKVSPTVPAKIFQAQGAKIKGFEVVPRAGNESLYRQVPQQNLDSIFFLVKFELPQQVAKQSDVYLGGNYKYQGQGYGGYTPTTISSPGQPVTSGEHLIMLHRYENKPEATDHVSFILIQNSQVILEKEFPFDIAPYLPKQAKLPSVDVIQTAPTQVAVFPGQAADITSFEVVPRVGNESLYQQYPQQKPDSILFRVKFELPQQISQQSNIYLGGNYKYQGQGYGGYTPTTVSMPDQPMTSGEHLIMLHRYENKPTVTDHVSFVLLQNSGVLVEKEFPFDISSYIPLQANLPITDVVEASSPKQAVVVGSLSEKGNKIISFEVVPRRGNEALYDSYGPPGQPGVFIVFSVEYQLMPQITQQDKVYLGGHYVEQGRRFGAYTPTIISTPDQPIIQGRQFIPLHRYDNDPVHGDYVGFMLIQNGQVLAEKEFPFPVSF